MEYKLYRQVPGVTNTWVSSVSKHQISSVRKMRVSSVSNLQLSCVSELSRVVAVSVYQSVELVFSPTLARLHVRAIPPVLQLA